MWVKDQEGSITDKKAPNIPTREMINMNAVMSFSLVFFMLRSL